MDRREQEMAVEADRERQALLLLEGLLAVIHGDGGHYVGEHGLAKAAADAHATLSERARDLDALRTYFEKAFLVDELASDLCDAVANGDLSPTQAMGRARLPLELAVRYDMTTPAWVEGFYANLRELG